jgi:glucarate dehydratase
MSISLRRLARRATFGNRGAAMEIVDYRVTPIAFGDPPLRAASGLHAPWALRTIVEVVSDDGISGVSETHGGGAVVDDLLAVGDLVVGRDPFQLAELEHILVAGRTGAIGSAAGPALWEGRLSSPPRTFGAIEVACLDLIGKALDRPVSDLLGGRVRDRVPYSAYLFYKHRGAGGALGFEVDPSATGWAAARQREALDAPSLVEQAQAMVQAFDFGSIKLKAGVLPPDEEVRTIKLLREAFGPDVPLRIDRTPPGRSKPVCATHPSSTDCSSTTKTPSPARKIWQHSPAPAISRWLRTCVA